MRVRKGNKQSKQLPSRQGMNVLGKSQRTIADYSKATPIVPTEPTAPVIQNLRVPRG